MVADDSSAEILVTADSWRGSIGLADNATLRFPLPAGESEYPNLWYLYTGVVRVSHSLTGEPLPDELQDLTILFYEFTGICGARSEFILSHDELTKTSTIYLVDGELDYYTWPPGARRTGRSSPGRKLSSPGMGRRPCSLSVNRN